PAGRHGEGRIGQPAESERDGRKAEAQGTERLGEARRDLGFELRRWPEAERAADERPGAAERRIAGAEVRAHAERDRDEGHDQGHVGDEAKDEESDRQACAEAMAARVDQSGGGWLEWSERHRTTSCKQGVARRRY